MELFLRRVICLVLPLFGALLIPTSADAAARRYVVDDAFSQVDAKVPFLGIATKTARFPDMKGALSLDIDNYEQVSMTVDVDARSLTTGDSETKRLRGKQFFDVANHPTVRFVAQKMELTGERSGVVTGLMTAKGVTRPVKLAIGFSKVPWEAGPDEPLSIVGTTTIDRRQFGMGAFPILIGHKVKITIHARMVPG